MSRAQVCGYHAEHSHCQWSRDCCVGASQLWGWVGQSGGLKDRKETLLTVCTPVGRGCLSGCLYFPEELCIWQAQLSLHFDCWGPPKCASVPSSAVLQEREDPSLYWNFAFGFGFALCNGIPCAFQDLSLTPPCRELGGACHIDAQTAGA